MNQVDESVLRAMIQESGEMWLAVRDRVGPYASPIVICQNPERAFYLTRTEDYAGPLPNVQGWIVNEQPLRMSDAADFFTAFGNHWPYWQGAVIRGSEWRAFIKNGRKEGWSISLDMKTQQTAQDHAAESLRRQRSAELIAEFRSNGPIREMISNELANGDQHL